MTQKSSQKKNCFRFYFCDPDFGHGCVCVQGVFDQRMKTWQKWQDSQMLLQKKREAEAKLQFTNKPDKLQQAKDEIKEVRAQLGTFPEPNGFRRKQRLFLTLQ